MLSGGKLRLNVRSTRTFGSAPRPKIEKRKLIADGFRQMVPPGVDSIYRIAEGETAKPFETDLEACEVAFSEPAAFR